MAAEPVEQMVLPQLGNYELLSIVGEGAIGTVYKARDRHTGQIVALKVMAPRWKDDRVLLKRFEHEFTIAQMIRHPNVVQALAYHASGATPYLVMEFVEGQSLGDRIDATGRLPQQEAVRLILQVCQGLHWVHKHGIIHRDIKPDNILITPDGQAKLTDLGLVKDTSDGVNLTKTGRGLGTPHYMAPEQFRNAKHADIRSDIYALGATLYTMVTGEIPFRNCGSLEALLKKARNEVLSPRALVATLSERVDWVVRRAMNGDADLRPQSCKEFARDLIGEQTVVKPPSVKRETRPALAGSELTDTPRSTTLTPVGPPPAATPPPAAPAESKSTTQDIRPAETLADPHGDDLGLAPALDRSSYRENLLIMVLLSLVAVLAGVLLLVCWK
jgi:serine/threonine protein kinase